jgi:hypothetical protein
MKKIKIILSLMFFGAFVMQSCIKDEVTELGDAGKPIVKFQDGPDQSLFYLPFLDTKQISLFDLRRDPNSNQELNTTRTITIQEAPELVDKYNKDNETEYEILPSEIYSLATNSSIVKNGTKYTITFGPGDFAKNFVIILNGAKWDLSKKFAMAFKVVDAAGTLLSKDKPSIITKIAIKNKYDGTYEVTGTMEDILNAGLTHATDYLKTKGTPLKLTLKTVSATKCAVYDPTVWADYFIPITSGGTGLSGYGTFAPIFEFDLATDKVIGVTNYYGTPANTRGGRLDPTGKVNGYDASKRTLTIKYNMTQRSLVPAAPHIRTTWDEVWKFAND